MDSNVTPSGINAALQQTLVELETAMQGALAAPDVLEQPRAGRPVERTS